MHIETTRFGSVTVGEDQTIHFAEGLPGFEETRSFVLLPHPGSSASDGESPFRWLQCVDEGQGALAFPVLSPWQLDEEYAPTVPGVALGDLKIDDIRSQAQVWAIVTIPRDQPESATVNLLAPVLINRQTRQARQIVLMSDRYMLRTPLKPPSETRAVTVEPMSQCRAQAAFVA